MGGHSTEEQRGVLPMIVHNLPMGWCLAAGQAYYELCAKLFWILVQFVGSDTYMSHTIMIQDKLWDEIFPRLVLVLVLFISGLLPFWGNNRIGAICHRVKIASFKIAAKMESAKMCFALILSFLQTLQDGGRSVSRGSDSQCQDLSTKSELLTNSQFDVDSVKSPNRPP